MGRDIELVRYLPHYAREYGEYRRVYAAQEPELDIAWRGADGLRRDMYLETAGAAGIRRYEGITGLRPLLSDGLEDRRARLILKWLDNIPYTMVTLRAHLDKVCGPGRYALERRMDEYTLYLEVDGDALARHEELHAYIAKILPANMGFFYRVKVYREARRELWHGVASFTHHGYRALPVRGESRQRLAVVRSVGAFARIRYVVRGGGGYGGTLGSAQTRLRT